MKKFIITITVLLLMIIGCTDQSSINSPVENIAVQEPNWIVIPEPNSGMQVNTEWTTSSRINGSLGGFLTNNVNYGYSLFNSNGLIAINLFSVEARIDFMPGAFSKQELISMTISDENTSVKFGPSMQFSAPVFYNVKYTGLNLSAINVSAIKFAYIANDGSIQIAQNEGIFVNVTTGTLSVKNAKIPHFSRYGFVN